MKLNAHYILSVLLLFSLGANVGLIAHRMGQQQSVSFQNTRHKAIAQFLEITRNLPEADREKAMRVIETDRPAMRETIQSVREQRDVIGRILIQPTIDQIALEQALAELRSRNDKAEQANHKMAMDIFPIIPLDQRQKLMQEYFRMQ